MVAMKKKNRLNACFKNNSDHVVIGWNESAMILNWDLKQSTQLGWINSTKPL